MWINLKDITGSGKFIKRALKFRLIIWGMPSSIFMYFMAFIFENMFVGITIRNISDVVFMTLSVWLAMKFEINQEWKVYESNSAIRGKV